MAASAVIATTTGEQPPRRLGRLWSDSVRGQQRARFAALRTRQFEEAREAGIQARDRAKAMLAANLPRELEGDDGVLRPVRVDVPSADAFALVLGVFRTGATLSETRGGGKILGIELSAQDIANLVGRSKATVEAVLRLIGCGPIEYKGVTYAHGLGLVHRRRRHGRGYLKGKLRWLYRTSSTMLTLLGRVFLGLVQRAKESRQNKAKQKSAPPTARPAATLVSPEEQAALRAQQNVLDDPSSSVDVDAVRRHMREKLGIN